METTKIPNVQPESAHLLELWKDTKSTSWYASTAKKISEVSLETPLPVNNNIKTLTTESVGEILNTLFKPIQEHLPITAIPERRSIHDWLWTHFVTDRIASLNVLRFLFSRKQNEAYRFYQVLSTVSRFLSFCSSKVGVPVHNIRDEHLQENLFYEYHDLDSILVSDKKILIRLFHSCFQGQKGLFDEDKKRRNSNVIPHSLLNRYVEILLQDGGSKFSIYFTRFSCSKLLLWLSANIARYQSYQPEHLPLFLVASEDLIAFRQFLMKQLSQGLISDHIASNILYYTRAWFSALFRERILPKDITLEVKSIPFERYHERELPTSEDLQQFFEVMRTYSPFPEAHITAFSLMLYLGLRISEVCELRWKDVNLATHTISILGKGTQSDLLPIPITLINLLTSLQKTRSNQEFIFTPKPQQYYVEIEEFYKLFSLIAGWKFPGGVHLFRHCFVTKLSTLNCPLQILMALARHKRPETTTIYIHRNKELPAAVNKIKYF